MIPESKFLKKGWASRDEQRMRRRSYRRKIKNQLRKLIK